jgi:hypothetical protein
MARTTTADCKKFLVDFHAKHPDFLHVYTEFGMVELDEQMRSDAAVASNWKRAWKGKPTKDASYPYWPEGRVYADGDIVDVAKADAVAADELSSVRIFELKPAVYETNVAIMVLEKKDGSLLLGEYVGCDDELDADWRGGGED